MAWTDLTSTTRQEAAALVTALGELRTATDERSASVGRANITYTSPVHIGDYTIGITQIRNGLELLIFPVTDGRYGQWDNPSKTFSPWGNIANVLTAAGYPGGWLDLEHQEDIKLWILQLRDVAEELIFYTSDTAIVLGLADKDATFSNHNFRDDTPQDAWDDVESFPMAGHFPQPDVWWSVQTHPAGGGGASYTAHSVLSTTYSMARNARSVGTDLFASVEILEVSVRGKTATTINYRIVTLGVPPTGAIQFAFPGGSSRAILSPVSVPVIGDNTKTIEAEITDAIPGVVPVVVFPEDEEDEAIMSGDIDKINLFIDISSAVTFG